LADVSKLRARRSGGLGSPPGPDDVATSLNAPEVAPAIQVTDMKPLAGIDVAEPYVRRDGRSARKTNRTQESRLNLTKKSVILQSART